MTIHLPKDDGVIDWKIRNIAGEPGRYMIETTQDEQPILEYNHARRESVDSFGDLSFGRQVASIPVNLWNRWIKENPEIKAGRTHPDYEKVLFRLINEHPKVKVNNDKLGRKFRG